MSPLTTEGLIEDMRRFRSDKMALVGLVGSMGAETETDALERLRDLIRVHKEMFTRRDTRRKPTLVEALSRDVLALAEEIEPWLARVVEHGAM